MIKEKKENLISRPPVVVVMGHVDHGKSSLLEAIKDFNITSKESGGITQHVGAYEAEYNGKKITFIDTPGHEAFSAIRSRGSDVADIAILVVAADEGVKPQTKEAIQHAKKAEIPIVVVINKMDKPGANPEKVKRELVKEDIVVEAMAGKIPSVEVSAKTKKGIPELLEMILLIADLENLRVDASKPAEGIIVESRMDSSRGPVATVIVQEGTLKKEDIVGTSSALGKVKILEDFQKRPINEASPSMPAIILGFGEVPGVGERFKVFSGSEEAEKGIKKEKRLKLKAAEDESDKKTVKIILKADALGSLEAVEGMLNQLPQEKVSLRILVGDVGDVNENDVKLAKSARAKILAFRVKANSAVKGLASREKITVIYFDIIYELVQAVRMLLEKQLEPEVVRAETGQVKILAVFRSDKSRQVLGGKVISGKVEKGDSVEVLRNNEKVGKGRIISLQKQKKDVDEAIKGMECGILYEGNAKAEEGDFLAAYTEERQKGEL